MSRHVSINVDGSITVVLRIPLKHDGKLIEALTLRPVSAGQILRWNERIIPSTLALLAEISDLPEIVIHDLAGADFQIVMTHYTSLMPQNVLEDFREGRRVLSTLYDDISPIRKALREQEAREQAADAAFERAAQPPPAQQPAVAQPAAAAPPDPAYPLKPDPVDPRYPALDDNSNVRRFHQVEDQDDGNYGLPPVMQKVAG